MNAGVKSFMSKCREIALDAYDWMIGLELGDVVVDGCITKAPCGGQKAGKSSVDRGKQGLKRSTVIDACGIPLGAIAAPANRHDSPLLDVTLDTLEILGPLPERISVHLDRGYDSKATREKLKDRGLSAAISEKGKSAPLAATKRWVVERTNSWNNAHKKLVWCTERRDRVIDFWIAFSEVIIIVRRLIRRGWSRCLSKRSRGAGPGLCRIANASCRELELSEGGWIKARGGLETIAPALSAAT